MADFIPRANAVLKTWLANLKAKFSIYAGTLGEGAEVATSDNNCDTLTAEINQVAIKKAEYEAAVQAKNTSLKQKSDYWRKLFGRMKKHNNWLDSMGEDMDIIGEMEVFDGTTYKPGINGQAFKGYNNITFQKNHPLIDGVSVYARMKGTPDWGLRIAYDTNSPYPHYGVLQGQTWEYMLVGVIDDVEVGLPSKIVELTAI